MKPIQNKYFKLIAELIAVAAGVFCLIWLVVFLGGKKGYIDFCPVNAEIKFDTVALSHQIELNVDDVPVKIYYTLDGKDPTDQSVLYLKPINLKDSGTLKYAAYRKGKQVAFAGRINIYRHLALGKSVVLKYPTHSNYSKDGKYALTNGIRGSTDVLTKHWAGFEKNDLEATIDLGEEIELHSVSAGFLQKAGRSVFLPKQIEISISKDNNEFKSIVIEKNTLNPLDSKVFIKDFFFNLKNEKARFIRVIAKNIEIVPKGHPQEGGKAFLFIDEIIVK